MRWCNVRNAIIVDKEKRKMFTYTEEKKFTKEQVQQLFLSVNWISGKYPERLYKALMNSSTVLTVWDEKKLIGLTRVLDDSEMLAQIHYVLVDPDYQGMGIAGKMIEYIKEKYKDFMYIDGMPEDKKNVPFYQKHGFSLMEMVQRFKSVITRMYNKFPFDFFKKSKYNKNRTSSKRA